MSFDINTLRSLSTVLAFLAFVGIFWWTFSSKRKQSFDDAANIPFRDSITTERKEKHDAEQQRGNEHD